MDEFLEKLICYLRNRGLVQEEQIKKSNGSRGMDQGKWIKRNGFRAMDQEKQIKKNGSRRTTL